MSPAGIGDYRAALRAIWERSAYDRGFISNPFWGDAAADLGLKRTAELLDRLGRPHERYSIIHVAGSKGKGSTCAFVESILRAAGYRAGRFTSPHLHTIRERIAVGEEMISETSFADLTDVALAAATSLERAQPDLGQVTAFELSTAMALRHFADAECDLVVIEVGMGGTLDATNVVSPLVSAITTLDFEHTRVLGDTIEEIAANKAGIIKPGRPVVVSAQTSAANDVILDVAARNGSAAFLSGREWQATGTWSSFTVEGPWGRWDGLRSALTGSHQIENAGAAVMATSLLNNDRFHVTEQAVRDGIATVRWPGRFEVVTRPGTPRYVLDGAHTPASATALAAAVAELWPRATAVVVLAVFGDKDPAAIVRSLAPVARIIIATTTGGPRAASSDTVAEGARAAGMPVEIADDVRTALERATTQAGPDGLVIVTGSLTTVAAGREALGLAVADPPVGDAEADPDKR